MGTGGRGCVGLEGGSDGGRINGVGEEVGSERHKRRLGSREIH